MRNIGKKTLLVFAVLLALATSASGDILNTSKFAKAVQFTASGCAVPSETPIANFPVLVRLSTACPSNFYDSFLGSTTNEVYRNLRFADDSGKNLDYEIDTWDTSGESLIWVSVPSLATNTIFTAYFSKVNDYTPPSVNPCEVWTKANYVGVWHMSEASGTVSDSSGHSLSAIPTAAATSNDVPGCVVGRGRQCDSGSYLSIADSAVLDVGSAFAVSGWFDMSSSQPDSGDVRFFSRKERNLHNDGWEVIRKGGKIAVRGASVDNIAVYTPSATFAGDGWKHLFVVYNGNTATIYEDGIAKTNATAGAEAKSNRKSLSIGSYSGGVSSYFIGNVDECRLLRAVPSAEWAKAEYDNVKYNAFLAVGDVETLIVPMQLSAEIAVSPIGYTNATVQVTVLSLGDASSATVTVDISEVSDFSTVVKTSQTSVADTGPVPFVFEGLTTNKTYYARATLDNQQDPLAMVEKDFKTVMPVAPTVRSTAFLSKTCSSLAATVVLSALGADVTTVRLEASTDGFSSVVARSSDMAAIVGEPIELVVEGLGQLTFYDLRVVVQNEWGFQAVVEVGRFETLPEGGLMELYVDSLGSGNGSSPASALPTIHSALDIAVPGCTIWVRGGEDRGYSIATKDDLMTVAASDVTICSYGGEGRAKVEISEELYLSANNASVITIPSDSSYVTISGLDFTYYGNRDVSGTGSLGNFGRVIDVSGDNATISNCTFRQIGNYSTNKDYNYSNDNMGQAAIGTRTKENAHVARYLTVRGCRFYGESDDRSMVATRQGDVGSVFSENVFSNCFYFTVPAKHGTGITFSSNVFYRCSSFRVSWSYAEWPSATFAYNIFFLDQGSDLPFVHKNGQYGLNVANVLIHHNTIVNAAQLALVDDNGNVSWQPQFFDNLILLDPTVADATVFKNDQTSFKEGNYSSFETGGVGCLKNNAWYAPGGISCGAATAVEGYDLSRGCAMANNIVLDAWPQFMSMDLNSPNFMRPRESRNGSWAIRGVAWTDDGTYPDYIGAVEPLSASSFIIHLR